MVTIYAHTASPRLKYICSFIFKELFHTDHTITTDINEFEKFEGVKINYSDQIIANCKLQIANCDLLFEEDIHEQQIECFGINGYKAFFKSADSFDIFAASFYLLSRYEEYLPHNKDIYGRYAHENSLAFKEGFLDTPLINIWVKDFALTLQRAYPSFTFHFSPFTFTPTYDIDIAWSYKHKGLIRNIGGAFKSLLQLKFAALIKRKLVLLGLKKDPFDSFEWMNELHEKYHLQPIYFFLVAEKNGVYDKNILPSTKAIKELIKQHAEKYSIGIHPSWQSGDDKSLLKKEIRYLENTARKKITQSRQHYIRFNLPEGYHQLIEDGITDDHSMGYGSINGFRASVASSFYWYDLKKEEETNLRVHPFCYMEANSYYEQKLSAAEAYNEMMHYYNACKSVDGTFISIWHNHFLGNDPLYKGWKETYIKFLEAINA
jgi:uncharacterized protein DUF7033